MSELNFYWRMGDYALEACPKHLAKLEPDDQNETIDLVKYYKYQGHECKYSIGYFYYNSHEPCWELKFVGGRFKELLEEYDQAKEDWEDEEDDDEWEDE